ncbi:putative digestive organ expansion factor, predicted [Medicago truncatula]|nr:U3 small nucleolar RNA-associated protein 25 isoform X1 [Medicago truncatula]XP_024631854.1 U3 small nucleolar RNA-associated protein 25 isoform X1 [Medicago truncatula]KEH37417.1 U3 small nucleolar RNA-associated-like protein [Medicago truncatula]RHN73410.1 putative digestive organ expansion factor, predicted [Medicago truncatula]
MKKRQHVAPTSESNSKRKKKEDKGTKKKKEGRRVEKETNVEIIKSVNLLEDDHDGEGSDIDSPRSNVVGSLQQNYDDNDSGLIEGSETEEDNEFSHSDEEDIRTNGGATSEDSVDLSSFDLHLQHNLSKEEIDSQKNLKFSWDVPVIGVSNCKWRGTGENILKDFNINSCPGLKEKLYEHWMDVSKTSGGKDINSPKQKMFFSLCSSYRDILYCNKRPFYLKGLEDTSIMDAYIMHSLNHVFRTRDRVKKNDSKLARIEEGADTERFRDQGFTRPKVLILLPFANIAYRVVKRLIQLTPSAYKVNVEHMDRFSAKFGDEEDKGDKENGEELENAYPQKPDDYKVLSPYHNEDDFMIGIKFTRKTIKLFSDFHTSDFIIASPLCLVNKIEETEINKEKDVDFLSSIEVLIIDHADVMTMQNWSHVRPVIEHLNRLPSTPPRTDVMRIRPWYLDEQARFYRQTIILGFYSNPEIITSFNHQCSNYEGKVKLMCEYKGVLQKVLPKIQQVYVRFNIESIVDADDDRFNYFVKEVFPRIKDSDQGGIMIFASSYFEFIRIRNFLKSQNASFCLVGEYTTNQDISRARGWFFKAERKIMLYTERCHFYRRFPIRGVKNLIMYSLPERKELYPEIVNRLDGSENPQCTALFSRLDKYRLERIVGTTHATKMVATKKVASEKPVFVFCD